MKTPKQRQRPVPAAFASVLAAVMVIGLASFGQADPAPATAAQTNAVPASAKVPVISKPAARTQLTGADLYSMHCNRCHPERYPTERTAAQWKTIMLHMQVRANIPVGQSRLILKYLQDNSGR
jgi:cytochrome c5